MIVTVGQFTEPERQIKAKIWIALSVVGIEKRPHAALQKNMNRPNDSAHPYGGRYRELVDEFPDLFSNPDREGISVLHHEADAAAAEASVGSFLKQRGYGPDAARVGVVFDDPYWTILRDAVRFPDGRLGTHVRLIRKPIGAQTVAILPIWNGHALLLKNFRHAVRDWRLEIPRGFAEPGQSPEENARRELLEEVGGTVLELVRLGGLEADSGITNDKTDMFLARLDNYGVDARHEGIASISAVSISELERMIRDGELSDSFTIAAYAQARLRGLI
jgi:ADP-ribose pyrophosphatase